MNKRKTARKLDTMAWYMVEPKERLLHEDVRKHSYTLPADRTRPRTWGEEYTGTSPS